MENENLTNHITCPNCGAKIPVSRAVGNAVGRKPLNIALTFIYKSLQSAKSKDGSPNYSAAARWLASKDIIASSGYIWKRIGREAEVRQISRGELLKEILKPVKEV